MKITEEELLTTQELMDRLKVSRETIRRWSVAGMPRVELSESSNRYQLTEVLKWRADVNAAKKKKGASGQ